MTFQLDTDLTLKIIKSQLELEPEDYPTSKVSRCAVLIRTTDISEGDQKKIRNSSNNTNLFFAYYVRMIKDYRCNLQLFSDTNNWN